MTSDGARLQDGIYWRRGERAPASLRLVLIEVAPGAPPDHVRDGLALVVATVDGLRQGDVRDLDGQPERTRTETAAMFADLRVLVAFGRRLFDPERHQPPLTTARRPDYLAYLPELDGPFPALPWDPGRRQGEADILIQLTADREAATSAAAVEIWQAIVDLGLPFSVAESFGGFGRADGRGWLGFHDGVNNLRTDDRPDVMVAGQDADWMAGGTYMAFLRLAVDLAAWRSVPRAQQELLVGRHKLTGVPVTGTAGGPAGDLRAVTDPAVESAPANSTDRKDPPQVTDTVVEASHVHRANQNRASGSAPGGLRMFRQGYEFLDAVGPDGPSVGLTFVSFQRDLAAVHHILHLPGWLGDVNFGGRSAPGPGEPAAVRFVSVAAGGLYAVPPRGVPFAGAGLFSDLTHRVIAHD